MLTKLLRSHLGPYRKALVLIVVLQTVQTSAALTLPTINARIIDKGVIRGDTGHIWSIGALMLAVTAVQASFSIGAVYCASKAAMGFGRDVRAALFHRVTDFSAREVNLFGAPSLASPTTCSRCRCWR